MNSAEARDELIRALRLDLIGPEPGSEHERKELPHEPSRWHLGGFQVPFRWRACQEPVALVGRE